jgi:DNA-binding NarL/FixJ family response regulator
VTTHATPESSPGQQAKIRVVVADDQPVVRAGFTALLHAQPDLEVVGDTGDGDDLVDLVTATQPDVAVVDIRMPRMDGIEACRRLAQAGVATKVLIVTTFDLDAHVFDALRAGASGFLLKDAPAARLVEAVRTVADGSMLLGPGVTRQLVEQWASSRARVDARWLDDLTPREREIALLVARGGSNAEIAQQLVVSEQTIKSHVSEVLRKLNVRDRVQVVVLAYEHGLVLPGQGE